MDSRMTANIAKPTYRDLEFSNSSLATYRTFPVILKIIQVLAGLICVVIAAAETINKFEDLTARSAITIAESQLRALGWIFEKAVNDIASTLNIGHVFIDQMTCRVVFITVSTILLIISSIQLTWFPVSLFSGPMKSRIISGVVYHFVGFVSQLAVSVNLLQRINLLKMYFYNEVLMRNLVWLGMIVAGLYLLSGITALWYLREPVSYGSESTFRRRRDIFEQPLQDPDILPRKKYGPK